ncbi:MAG: ABC transporter permease [Gemmataceae bacterium]
MRALDRKLLRDLWHIRGQALAIILVMASGIAIFEMSLSVASSLKYSLSTYYDQYRFADVFASLKRAPNNVRQRLAKIPGVAAVQTRVLIDVTLGVKDLQEPAVGRILSIPEQPIPVLNDIYLKKGRYIEPGRRGEVIVSEPFAKSHKFEPGDHVLAVINGTKEKLKIVGIALSPEYVFGIRPGEIIPDDERFGIFWMSYQQLAPAYNMEGAFNDVALRLAPNASKPEVIRRVDQVLEPYGGLGAFGREDQTSNKFVANEMRQLSTMAFVTPLIFLLVAAFLLNVVMQRQVQIQREQIAALKAFGYSQLEIGVHYLKMVLVLIALGMALGTVTGLFLGRWITMLYSEFFHFPGFHYYLDFRVVVFALIIAGGGSLLGTLAAVRQAMKLPPAEAMRPEPPKSYRPTLLERIGLGRLFTPSARMIFRHLEREPRKSGMAILGISLAVAVLVLGNFIEDAVSHLVDFQFFNSQRQDMTISFVEPVTSRGLYEIRHLPGVRHVEPFRSVPVRIRSGHRSRRLGIMGLDEDRHLFRPMDVHEKPVTLPNQGLVISDMLAKILEVKRGDKVRIEVLQGERPVREVIISDLINDYSDVSAYMNRKSLHRLMREADSYSGAFLLIDRSQTQELYTTLKNTPQVATVNVKYASLENFNQVMEENILRMKMINAIFASIIAFGVVYNAARISLAERSHELATLRVLGFTRAEISIILLGELAVITLLALPLGLALGYGLSALMVSAMQSEVQRIPFIIGPGTYAFAVAVVLVASILSGLVVRRRLDHLDLVSVLKARE